MHFTKTAEITSTIKNYYYYFFYNNKEKPIPIPIITKGDVRKEQPLHRRQQRVTPTRCAEPNKPHNRMQNTDGAPGALNGTSLVCP